MTPVLMHSLIISYNKYTSIKCFNLIVVIIVHKNYRFARPEAIQTQTGQFQQARSLASSPDYEFQPLLIYDGPQILGQANSTNHQLGSNLHNQSRTG